MANNKSVHKDESDVDSENEDDEMEFALKQHEDTSEALWVAADLDAGAGKGSSKPKSETKTSEFDEKSSRSGLPAMVFDFTNNLFLAANDSKPGTELPPKAAPEIAATVPDKAPGVVPAADKAPGVPAANADKAPRIGAAAEKAPPGSDKAVPAVADPKVLAIQTTLLDGDLAGKPPVFKPIGSDVAAAPVVPNIFDQLRGVGFNSPMDSFGVQDARRAEKDGDIKKAIELWTKEQEQLKKGYGNEVAIFDSCKELARLYEKMPDKSTEARKQYEAAIEICKKQLDWSDRWDSKLDATVSSLHLKVAKTYEAEGKTDKALEAQKQALAVANKGESTDYNWAQKKDGLKIECHNAIAATLLKNGKGEDAVKEYQETLKLIKRQSGYSDYGCPQDKDIIAIQSKMAEALVKAGKNDEAVKVYEQNLTTLKRQRGYSDYSSSPLDNDVIRTQRSIAQIRAGQGRYDDAFKALEENFKLLDRKYSLTGYGDNKAAGAHAQYRSDMADLYAKRAESRKDDPNARNADYDKALKERQKELEIYKREQDYDYRNAKSLDPNIFAAQRETAKYLKALGKDEEALQLERKQTYLMQRAEAKPADIALCQQKIAAGYEKLGKMDQAIEMHKAACYSLQGKEGYTAAHDRLAEVYKKVGKDIRVEEAREDKEAFERCDAIEKFPYIFSKLPNKLAIETSAEGTKLSTDNLPKLLEAAPGMMLDKVLKNALSLGKSPEETEKIAEALMQALRDTTEVSIKGNKIEFTRKSTTEIPYGADLGPLGKVNGIKMGQKISFELEADPADPGKVRIKDIQGISAVGERPNFFDKSKPPTAFSIDLKTIEIADQKNKEGKTDRVLSINGIPIKLAENVSEDDSAAFKEHLKLMTDTLGKLGKGDLYGLLQMLGANEIPQALKDLFTDVKAIKKDGGNIHLDVKKEHVMTVGDFTGGAAINGNPTVTIATAVDFYMSPNSKHSIDLMDIKGITINSDGWMGRLLGKDGHLKANLSKVYVSGQVDGDRSVSFGFDKGLHDIWVKLNAQGQPRANSTISLRVDNPIGGKKESIDIKVDENGQLSAGSVASEGLYLLLEGLRKGWMPD